MRGWSVHWLGPWHQEVDLIQKASVRYSWLLQKRVLQKIPEI